MQRKLDASTHFCPYGSRTTHMRRCESGLQAASGHFHRHWGAALECSRVHPGRQSWHAANTRQVNTRGLMARSDEAKLRSSGVTEPPIVRKLSAAVLWLVFEPFGWLKQNADRRSRSCEAELAWEEREVVIFGAGSCMPR